MLIHFSGIAVVTMVPGVNILAPFILWILRKKESSWIDLQGRRVLNFQIGWSVITLILLAFAYILTFVLIGFLLYPLVGFMILGNMILSVYAGIKAYRGENYRYPVSIKVF